MLDSGFKNILLCVFLFNSICVNSLIPLIIFY